jgi:hypothetical protein
VFVWSRKHHRYETAYIERNVTGHFPVTVINSGDSPSFSLILENDDGQRVRKTYSFEGFRVRMVRKEPFTATSAEEVAKTEPAAAAAHAAVQHRSLYSQLREQARKLFGR